MLHREKIEGHSLDGKQSVELYDLDDDIGEKTMSPPNIPMLLSG